MGPRVGGAQASNEYVTEGGLPSGNALAQQDVLSHVYSGDMAAKHLKELIAAHKSGDDLAFRRAVTEIIE